MSQHAFIFSVCIQWLLRLVVTEMKTSHNMSENIARTSSKLGDAGYALPDTLESCQKALVQATRQLKASLQDKIETKNLCREHQNTLIQTYKTSGNSKLAENIRGLQQAKEMQQVFKKCQHARRLCEEWWLSHLLVPTNPADHPRTCIKWRHVYNRPIRNDGNVTSQKQGTLWPVQRLHVDITSCGFYNGIQCNRTRADATLNGTFLQPTNLEPVVKLVNKRDIQDDGTTHGDLAQTDPSTTQDETDTPEMLTHCPLHMQHIAVPKLVWDLVENYRYATAPDAIPAELTPKEYRGKLKAWDETTSMPPTMDMHLLPIWERLLLQELIFIKPETDIWKALCESQCWVESDGSAPALRGMGH